MKYIWVIALLGVLVAGLAAAWPVGAAVGGTAATTTTTTTTTTTPTPSPTWKQVTAFPRPAFKAQRRIIVTSASAFWHAWNAIRPGDKIVVRGVTFRGESTFSKKLSGWAEVHFVGGTAFAGQKGANRPAAWIHDSSHIRFYGGWLTNPRGGAGITLYDSSYVTWWDFKIDRTANTGLFVQGIKTAVTHVDLRGEISHWGLNLALDPHAEKGTGMHGANLADANTGVSDSRFSLYLHDGAAGSGVEAGGAKSTDFFRNNQLYLRCVNLTMVAKVQVGGNCVQVWGENVTGNAFKYLRANTLQGRPYDATGMYGGQSLATNSVAFGRAVQTNLNPLTGSILWDARASTTFGDVSPTG